MKTKCAFILAAGLGSRLKPWTDFHPKALAIVNGKSLLERNVKYLQSFGIETIVINVHHFADQIIDEINKNKGWGCTIKISDETENVLETGGGLLFAKKLLKNNENFVLMNCDILTDLNLENLEKAHLESDSLATLAVSERNSSRKFLFSKSNHLVGWKNTQTLEIKNPKNLNFDEHPVFEKAFSGIHIISSKIFDKIKMEGKFGMVELYLDLCKENNILAFQPNDYKMIDVGKSESIVEAEKMFF